MRITINTGASEVDPQYPPDATDVAILIRDALSEYLIARGMYDTITMDNALDYVEQRYPSFSEKMTRRKALNVLANAQVVKDMLLAHIEVEK